MEVSILKILEDEVLPAVVRLCTKRGINITSKEILEELNPPIINTIIEGDNLKVLEDPRILVDGVITSPPYNLGKDPNHGVGGKSLYGSYDDNKPEEEYIGNLIRLFKFFEKRVNERGAILLNLNYGSSNPSLPYKVVTSIEKETDYRLADVIAWIKDVSTPFQTSPTNLSRRMEQIFVLVRYQHRKCFITNKEVSKVNERTGQKFYKNYVNIIEAKNNDRGNFPSPYLKASYSTDLVGQLLEIYFPPGSIVLDPFVGIGTTAISCLQKGRNFVGIDIDPECVKISKERILNFSKKGN